MNGQSILRQQQSALCGQALPARPASARTVQGRRCVVAAKAESEQVTDRRAALGMLAGVAALVNAQPSRAAFGEGANVFGKPTNTTGLIPYKGNGFQLDLPAKWVISHEVDVPNLVLRYEDTQDTLNYVAIFKLKGGSAGGDAVSFLKNNAFLFGQNVWQGSTDSEGGFKKNQVSKVDVIDAGTENRAGKQYITANVLTRAADGNEGGRHNLIAAASGGGDLWVIKVQAGEKRWFRGAGKAAQNIFNSFTVA